MRGGIWGGCFEGGRFKEGDRKVYCTMVSGMVCLYIYLYIY